MNISDEWDFGSDNALAERLKAAVLSGKKTATTDIYDPNRKTASVGDHQAILDSKKERFCIVEITRSRILPFLEVDWDHVKLEGEDYTDLEDWREQHREFFRREYGSFTDESLVVCDEFRLVQKFDPVSKASAKLREACKELWHFFIANLRASYFGAFLLAMFLLTEVVTIPLVSRYDFIFLAAVGFQICALIFKFERLREFLVIILFHVLATGMELFKTHPSIGSWSYPDVSNTAYVLGTVPLFTGFLYSAVGSYISRAFMFLKLSYDNFPARFHVWALASLIYLNFFLHHFIFDIRYLLYAYTCIVFYKTRVHFQVYKKRRSIPFLLSAFLSALFVWVAENVGTITSIWLYPSQIESWHLVSFGKMGSWFLLLILSFALVSMIYRDKLYRAGLPAEKN